MVLQVEKELDFYYEIIGLLHHGGSWPQSKNELISQISDMGINGETYYSKNFKTLDKYVTVFKKNMIKSEDFDFFLVIAMWIIINFLLK